MEERKSFKISLGTVICLFVIILLIIALVYMYLQYNKRDIIKDGEEIKVSEIEEKEIYIPSDFELIYNALTDVEYNNIQDFITSENTVKKIDVIGITIYNEEYLNVTETKLTKEYSENEILGSCVFSIEFEDIEGLELAGSKGNTHGIVGNCLIDEKEFIFNKNTNTIELCTSVYREQSETNESETETEEKSNTSILSKSETQDILGPDNAKFCIEDIKKDGEDYIITAYMLEKESKKISDSEYNDLINGKEIEFRNQKWKYISSDDYFAYVQSGDNRLSLSIIGKTFGNTAGVEASLSDYSKQKITFKVSNDILIGAFWANFKYDKNGNIKAYGMEGTIEEDNEITNFESLSFERLQEISEGCKGTYDECEAYVKNGIVEAIKIYEK